MIFEVISSIFLVCSFWYMVSTYWMKRRMPPGPIPFPWLGNLPQILAQGKNPFGKLSEKYGDIYSLYLPVGPTVVLNTAGLARCAQAQNVNGKTAKSLFPLPEILGEDLITADYGAKFKIRRKALKSALHVAGEGIPSAQRRAQHAVQVAVEKIEGMKGEPFIPMEIINSSILVQLWEWLSSKKVSTDDPVIKLMEEYNEIAVRQVLESTAYQVIPFFAYFSKNLKNDISRAKEIKDIVFASELKAHMKTYTPGVIRDMTDSFISSYEKEIVKNAQKVDASMDDIPHLMYDIIAVGSDTTSGSVSWFLLHMVVHQDVQSKIQDELDNVVGKDRFPHFNDAKHMPYLQAVLCEVQRIASVFPLIRKSTICDVKINDYDIPRETLVVFNYFQIHHDDREWPEPNEFKPERFLDDNKNFVGWTKLPGFMPFGLGLRECPGQNIAKVSFFLFASTLLHLYKFDLPEGAEIPSTEATGRIVRAPQPFKVVTRKRNVGRVADFCNC